MKPTEQPLVAALPKSYCTFLAETALAVQTGSHGNVALCRCLEVVLGRIQMLKTVPYSTFVRSDMSLFGLLKLFAFYSTTMCQIERDEEYRKLYK